jgi:hypothetical protein
MGKVSGSSVFIQGSAVFLALDPYFKERLDAFEFQLLGQALVEEARKLEPGSTLQVLSSFLLEETGSDAARPDT